MSAFYDLAKRAFKESLDLVGVPIVFAGLTKQCITGEFQDKLPWQKAGRVINTDVNAAMLDDDYNAFELAGVEDAQAKVRLNGSLYLLRVINREPTDPVVTMNLTIDK